MSPCSPECVKPRPGSRLEHCKSCHQSFSSTRTGDGHRTGHFGTRTGPDRRRCRTVEEMTAVGLWQDRRGIWRGRVTESGVPKRWSGPGTRAGADLTGSGGQTL